MEPTREQLLARIARAEGELVRKQSHKDGCKTFGRTPRCTGRQRIMDRRKRKPGNGLVTYCRLPE